MEGDASAILYSECMRCSRLWLKFGLCDWGWVGGVTAVGRRVGGQLRLNNGVCMGSDVLDLDSLSLPFLGIP